MYAHIPFDRYKSWRAICLRWLIFFTLKQQAYYTDSVYLDYIEDDYYNSVSIYDLILFIAQQSNVLMGKLPFTYSPIVEPFIRDRDEWSIHVHKQPVLYSITVTSIVFSSVKGIDTYQANLTLSSNALT